MMKVPLFVQDLMRRSYFVLGRGEPGYTIKIEKRTPYAWISSLEGEVKRLERWATRNTPKSLLEATGPIMVINKIPQQTKYRPQYAEVTIYDPIMRALEKYIMEKYSAGNA